MNDFERLKKPKTIDCGGITYVMVTTNEYNRLMKSDIELEELKREKDDE